jgi:hypothetical protein
MEAEEIPFAFVGSIADTVTLAQMVEGCNLSGEPAAAQSAAKPIPVPSQAQGQPGKLLGPRPSSYLKSAHSSSVLSSSSSSAGSSAAISTSSLKSGATTRSSTGGAHSITSHSMSSHPMSGASVPGRPMGVPYNVVQKKCNCRKSRCLKL